MSPHPKLSGIYAAALTPVNLDFSAAIDDMPVLLNFLAKRGCHGALLFGTTGEGPSFSPTERLEVLRAARAVRQNYPDFRLLVGTGTPSMQETIELTRSAFDLGADGVVVLPPYYFRKVKDEGLFAWYSQVIRKSVPPGGALLGYHFPAVSGVPLSIDLLARLKDSFKERFAGIKDSSGDAEHCRALGDRFGKDLLVFTGNDRLLSIALENRAAGCITALANLRSTDARLVWDAFQQADEDVQRKAQDRLERARLVLEDYQPAPATLKALIYHKHHFRRWAVRPPLLPLTMDEEKQLLHDIAVAEDAFTQ
jgi:4-hydroxy-tetrahydrodipicolinate synthase